MPTRTGRCWAGRAPSIDLVPSVGAVEAGLVAGGPVFQALMVAAGVGPGSQAYHGGQAACTGSRSGCGCQSGLPGLRRGACGDRNLLRPCCGCGARRVRGSGVQAPGCASAVGTQCSVQKTGCPRLGLCSPPHPAPACLLPSASPAILTCLLCTCCPSKKTWPPQRQGSKARLSTAGSPQPPTALPQSACQGPALSSLPGPGPGPTR